MSDDKEARKKRVKYLKLFGASEKNNFQIIDTIGVPHPYCITPKHVTIASDDHMGMLGKEAIEDAEKQGVQCGTKFKDGGQCNLPYNEHKQALLVECKQEMYIGKPDKDNKVKWNPELHKWLNLIKDKTEKMHFAGFSFLDARKKVEI